jgi:hypothetical protein
VLVFFRPFPPRTPNEIVLSISRWALEVKRNVNYVSVKSNRRNVNVLLHGGAL